MSNAEPERDEEREDRILMEIVVDCYNTHERAMGWCGYLEQQLQFPFAATYITNRATASK
jgi:hypothetical protein